MASMWIAALAMLVVMFVVLALSKRVIDPIIELRGYLDDTLQDGVKITGDLDTVADLLEYTDDIVNQVAVGATRYGNGLMRVTDLVQR
jgi:hypothetical protein